MVLLTCSLTISTAPIYVFDFAFAFYYHDAKEDDDDEDIKREIERGCVEICLL